MLSSIINNDSIYYNNSQYQRRSQIEFIKNKYLPKINKNQKIKSNTLINNNTFLTIKSQKSTIKTKYNEKTNSFEEKAFKNFIMKNKKSINNMSNCTFNKSSFSLIKKEKYNIKQLNKSLFPLIYKDNKNDRKESNNNSLIKENDYFNDINNIQCNYLYLQYKGENNNKGFNKITFIEINPHKIISSLNEITKGDNCLKKKLFNSIRRQIHIKGRNNINNINNNLNNNYSSKSDIYNYNNYYYEILNKINNSKKNKNEKSKEKNDNNDNNKEDINKNKNSITFVYDKFLLPNKNNKYNYSIHNLFLFDIINKVFKRMIELHDNNNQTITEDQILKEYNRQVHKLKNYFDNKTNQKNINNKQNNFKDEYSEIKSKNTNESIYKNAFLKDSNENNKIINKEKEHENEEYEYDNILNRETFFNLKEKIIRNSKYSLKNLFETNNKKSIYNTTRKLMPNFKIKDKNTMHKNSSMPNFIVNKKNNLDKDIYRFEIGPKLNIIDFNEISYEIYKQAKIIKNNTNNLKMDENDLINFILLNKRNIKKLKFNNPLINRYIKIVIKNEKKEIKIKKEKEIKKIYNNKRNKFIDIKT